MIMTQSAFEWDPRPPTVNERLICGVWLTAFMVAVANRYFAWRLLQGFDNWVLFALLVVVFFLIARLPTVRRNESIRRPLGYWLTIGAGVVGALVLTFIGSQH
jgi:hypothetical protein